ncbi:MAG: DUF6516 family protein [Candidatus Electrothrix sp. Rat3]|nr:DUF6516 family protein [Candidatus Electrothrix rattekaaiensis]
MNPLIEKYFDEAEVCLIANRNVSSYMLIRREIAAADGKLRAKVSLYDNSMLEFFLYVKETEKKIQLEKYSFHWQDAQGKLRRRWDNAPHHPALDNAPHHLHLADGSPKPADDMPDLPYILDQVEDLSQKTFSSGEHFKE